MTATVCPFCNGILPPLSAPPKSDKLPCPKCGEPVPASRWSVDPTRATAVQLGQPPIRPTATGEPVTYPLVPPRSGTNRTALIVLGIMLVMAIVGLSYALWTTKLRRSRDPHVEVEPVTFRRPLELPALGYLPKQTQIVVALHIAELMNDAKVGKPLLESPRPFALDFVVKQILRTTAMPIEQIDHVLLAAAFEDQLPDQVVLIVKTRVKYSLEKIVEAIQPTKSSLHEQQALYEFSLKPMGEAMLWAVEEKTLVYVLRIPGDPPKLEHLQGLSVKPRPVKEVLSPIVYQAIEERLQPKHNFVWAAGNLDRLGAVKAALPLMAAGKVEFGPLLDVKTFALGVEPVEGLTLTGYFHMSKAKSMAQLKTVLEGLTIAGVKSQKVELPPAEVQDPAAQWATWQVRSDVDGMREILNLGKEVKK